MTSTSTRLIKSRLQTSCGQNALAPSPLWLFASGRDAVIAIRAGTSAAFGAAALCVMAVGAAPGRAQTAPPGFAAAAPVSATTIEEVAYKGCRDRALHDAATATLRIELNDKLVGTVPGVGQMKKPQLLRGTYLSGVWIWNKNIARDCSSHVLVTIPMAEGGGDAEVKAGFGPCN